MSDSDDRRRELEQLVDQSEDAVHAAFESLEKAAVRGLSLGNHVAAHPWHWFGGAALIGMIWGIRDAR